MLDFCRATFDDPVAEKLLTTASQTWECLVMPCETAEKSTSSILSRWIRLGEGSSPTVEVSRPNEGLVGSEVLTDTRKTNSTGPVHKM